jgi:hypothetical protein
VADRQSDSNATERFSNTKLNIALINDPKNGPRFTLTKREVGLDEAEKTEAPSASDRDASSRLSEIKAAIKADAKPNEPCRPEAIEPGHQPAMGISAGEQAEPQRPEQSSKPDKPVFSLAQPAPTPPLTPGDQAPRTVLVDSSKTFVGPNGTYYDESWRWMDWRGTRRSWNWPAALSFGHWFAYRRLYGIAALYLLWLSSLSASAVNGVPVIALIIVAALVVGLTGIYGNTLYFLAFRRAVKDVTENGKGSYDERKGQLAAAGGIDIRASWVMGGITGLAIAAAIGITLHMRGGLVFNLWPL